AAMRWCAQEQVPIEPQWGVRTAAATGTYWIFNDIELGCRLALDALRRDRAAADSEARCKTLLDLARMYIFRGHGEQARPHARMALEVARRLGAIESQATALDAIGFFLRQEGDEQAALQHCE